MSEWATHGSVIIRVIDKRKSDLFKHEYANIFLVLEKKKLQFSICNLLKIKFLLIVFRDPNVFHSLEKRTAKPKHKTKAFKWTNEILELRHGPLAKAREKNRWVSKLYSVGGYCWLFEKINLFLAKRKTKCNLSAIYLQYKTALWIFPFSNLRNNPKIESSKGTPLRF